jgi:phosphoserine phosphatase RsbU/P
MAEESAHPPAHASPSAVDGIVHRFVEELYHTTAGLTQGSGTTIAFLDRTGVQWLALDDRCICCRQTAGSPPCIAPNQPEARVCEHIDVGYEGASLGTVLVCCERGQQSLLKAARPLVHAARRHVELERENHSLVEELCASWESLEAVYEISSDMRLFQDSTELLNRITARAVSGHEGLQAVLWRADAGRLVPVSIKTNAVIEARPSEGGLIGRVVERREAIILNGQTHIAAAANSEPELRRAVSVAITPVATRQAMLGALEVWQEKGTNGFDSRLLRLLETLALQAAMVIETDRLYRDSIESERLRQEVQIGSDIQQMLLLGQPPDGLIDLDIAALTVPSQRVDGDFYEFVKHHDRCLDIIVGDVMGKGIPAALLGAATKSHFLRAIGHLLSVSTPGKLAEPVEIVTAVSAAVARQLIDLESFVTLCYARLDLDARRLDFVDCGHTRTILLRRRSGRCEYLQGKNLPLGVIEGETYQQVATSIEEGDVLLFYSDGVTETHDAAGNAFGEAYLAEVVRTHGHLSPTQMIDAIRAGVTSFSQSGIFEDDFTCVAVKIGAATDSSPRAATAMELTSDLSELSRVRDFVRRVCSSHQQHSAAREEGVHALVQAVNEAVTNIIAHAYRGQPGQRIRLEAEVIEDRTIVRIYDWGEAFDTTAVEPPAFDGSRETGFGLYIIAHCVDEVHYERDDQGRNCVSLMKILGEKREENS